MNTHYKDLFNVIVKYNQKDLDIKFKQSLNAVIDMFSNEIYNNVINEMKKQGLPLPQPMGMAQPMNFAPPV